MSEPERVYPEELFQKSIVDLLNAVLSRARRPFALIEGFGLDIAIFLGGSSRSNVRLFEVKSFSGQRLGGVGFGNRHGKGPQVDLLLSSDLAVFDATVRWIYADGTLAAGTCRYALLTCTDVKAAAMGDVARGKQNNLSISKVRESLVNWPQLCAAVESFLLV